MAVKIGRGDQARFIMERLRGNEGENILAKAEFQDIRSVSKLEKKAGNGLLIGRCSRGEVLGI
jgi:hypothetical protein